MRESRSPPPFNEEPQISKDFWGFFVFLPADLFLLRWGYSSSDFTDESDGNLAYRITYGFPRIFGRWLMALARNELRFFCHADFADDADFFSLIILVPQISQIYTDFFHWLFKFHRFTDSHRFFSFIIFLMDLHGFSLVLFFPCHFFFFSVISLFRRF